MAQNNHEVKNMSRSRKSRLLVPEAYDKLNQFKLQVAQEIGRMDFVKENNDHYKGDVTAKQNGLEGGPIGGEMVKRMIASYSQNLIKE